MENKNTTTTELEIQNIEAIEKQLSQMQLDMYSLQNGYLIEAEERVRDLYCKMLCSTVIYKNTPTVKQLDLLKRLMYSKAVKNEVSLTDYMRMATEITAQDVAEFIESLREEPLKYNFAIDSLLVSALSDKPLSNDEYLCSLYNALDIRAADMEYLCAMSKGILKQDSSTVDEAKKLVTENTTYAAIYPYLQYFYAGNISTCKDELYYTAPVKSMSQGISYKESYSHDIVTFENLIIDLSEIKGIAFSGCKEVEFKDCTIIGTEEKAAFEFSNVGRIVFDNCDVSRCKSRVAYMKNCNNLIVTNCKFNDCGLICDVRSSIYGGVFYCNEGEFATIKFDGNTFHNCRLVNNKNTYQRAGGIILGAYRVKTLEITNNSFSGCTIESYYSDEYSLFGVDDGRPSLIYENNEVSGQNVPLYKQY